MKSIALLHTVQSVADIFGKELQEFLPEPVIIRNLWDDYLANHPQEVGEFTIENRSRLFLDMKSLEMTNADVIAVTCSTLTPIVEKIRPFISVPVIAIDDAMGRKAAKEGKTLASFIDKLEKGYEEREYRFKITGEDFKEYGKQVLAAFENRAKEKGYAIAPNSYEGIRITFDSDEVKGWLLLRMSLHDPQMPLNVEGVREGDCDKLYDIVIELLDGFDRLVVPAK